MSRESGLNLQGKKSPQEVPGSWNSTQEGERTVCLRIKSITVLVVNIDKGGDLTFVVLPSPVT